MWLVNLVMHTCALAIVKLKVILAILRNTTKTKMRIELKLKL